MAHSFGMDTKPTSNNWADISRGPTLREVRDHVAKLHELAKSAK